MRVDDVAGNVWQALPLPKLTDTPRASGFWYAMTRPRAMSVTWMKSRKWLPSPRGLHSSTSQLDLSRF